jgi:hypothetical protein
MSKESTFESVVGKLTNNQKRFLAELTGTFIVVVLATGSVVIDAKLGGVLGLPFIAFAPFVGVAIGVYLFGKISMAHFNPAVSVGFLITKHITKKLFVLYLLAEIVGALLASLFVSIVIGKEANFAANAPDYSYPLPLIFGISFSVRPIDDGNTDSSLYKRLERIWRYCYWGYYWIRYFVFGFYFWCFYESCSFIGSRVVIRNID